MYIACKRSVYHPPTAETTKKKLERHIKHDGIEQDSGIVGQGVGINARVKYK